MKKLLNMVKHFILLISIIVLIGCNQEKKNEINYDLVISSVNLIDGTGNDIRQNVNVYIKDSRISRIDTLKVGVGKETALVNGKGKYLIPGLIDGHAHPGPPEENFPKFIHYGVTGILVPGCGHCSDEHYTHMRNISKDTIIPSPRVYHTSQHFTMEGRHPVKTYGGDQWVHEKTVFLLEDTLQIAAYVKRVAQNPIKGIKVTIEDGPHPPFVPRIPQEFVTKIVKEAKKYDLEVFAHVDDMEEVRIAEKAGVQNIIHFIGVDVIWERDKEVIESLGSRNVSWVTTLMMGKSFMYPLNPEWLEAPELALVYKPEDTKLHITPERIQLANEINDFIENVMGIPDPNLENTSIPQVEDIKLLEQAGCNIVIGTDTYNAFIFPGYSMHEEMQLMEIGGYRPIEIIKMATLNAAKMLHVEDSIGSIEIEKKADMVLLHKNPLESISNTLAIHTVIKNGIIQKRIIQ
ncbi:MAG: amidohydrolase family protein [Saonia sp.]